MIRLPTHSRARPTLAVVIVTGLSLGCGDADTYKLHSGSWGDLEPATDLQGTLVELLHVSSRCDAASPGALALVGDQIEFENCAIVAPKAGCSPDSRTALAIDIQPRAVLYDFSNVANPSAFERAAFNGYVIANLGASPEIIGAAIDRDLTTLDLDDADVVIDRDAVRVNFEGLAFDETDFVKVDLEFADPSASGE